MQSFRSLFWDSLVLSTFLFAATPALLAQTDSSYVDSSQPKSSLYLGVGPVFPFRPILLSYSATAIFKNSWGVSADYMRYSDRIGTLGQGESAFSRQNNLVAVRLVKEIPLTNPRFRLQLAAGPSFGTERTRYWSQFPGEAPQSTEYHSSGVGIATKISMVARLNDYIGFSGGVHLGYNRSFSVNGPEVSVLIGRFGTQSIDEAARTRPLQAFTEEELVGLESKYRRQAGWALAVGSLFTAAAVAGNALGVAEYHKGDTWARLGGTLAFVASHVVLAPVGTSLLVLGFDKRGKANRIRTRLNSNYME